MKIALVGSSGYISGFIIERLKDKHEIIKIDKMGETDYYLDLQKSEDFEYGVLNGIEQVIFPAAISSPDLCEKEFQKCWQINVEGTGHFVNEALKRGCRVLFFSSDAVFGDHPDLVFDEDSLTEASTAYGKMKKAIEDRFKENRLFKAIRLSYVVSRKDKFTKYALSCREKNEVCEVFDPFNRNCIVVSDVLDCIEWLMKNWEIYDPSFLNIAGRDLVSREDIVKAINKISERKIEYKIIYPGDDFYKCRPVTTNMRSLYLFKDKILKDESFEEKICREFLQ